MNLRRIPFFLGIAGLSLVFISVLAPFIGFGRAESFILFRTLQIARSDAVIQGVALCVFGLVLYLFQKFKFRLTGLPPPSLQMLSGALVTGKFASHIRQQSSSLLKTIFFQSDRQIGNWLLGPPSDNKPPGALPFPLGDIIAIFLCMIWAAFVFLALNTNFNASEYGLSAGIIQGDIIPAQGSVTAWISPFLLTKGGYLVSLAMHVTGWSAYETLKAVSPILVFIGLFAIYWITGRLAGTPWAGLAAVLVLPGSWLNQTIIGFHLSFWTGNMTAGTWGIIGSAVTMAAWLRLPNRGWRAAIPWFMAGLVFCLHVTFGGILAVALCLGHMMDGSQRLGERWRHQLIFAAVFLFSAFPLLMDLVHQAPAIIKGSDELTEDWWRLMILRKNFHLFLWGGPNAAFGWRRALELALLTGGTVYVAWSMLDVQVRTKIVGIVAAVVIFCAISLVGELVLQSSSIISLILTRSTILAALLVLVLSCVIPARLIMNNTGYSAMAILLGLSLPILLAFSPAENWIRLLMLAVLMALAVHRRSQSGGALTLLTGIVVTYSYRQATEMEAISAMTQIALFAGSFFLLGRFISRTRENDDTFSPRHSCPHRLARVAVTAGIALLFLLAYKATILKSRANEALTEEWLGAIHWLRNNTPKDTIVLVPPYPYADVSLSRSHVYNYLWMGFSIYVKHAVPLEMDRLRLIYGIDLSSMNRADIWKLVHQPGLLCLVEKGYVEAVSDTGRLSAIEKLVPGLRYVMAPRQGVTPPQWSCGKAQAKTMDLPVAYSNSDYVIYFLSPAESKEP